MAKLKLEVWRSTMNNEEKHYFLVNEGTGYQPHKYVFGYNPQLIKPPVAKKLLEYIIRHI